MKLLSGPIMIACALASIPFAEADVVPGAITKVGFGGFHCGSVAFFNFTTPDCPSPHQGTSDGFDGELPDGTPVSGRATSSLLGPGAAVQGNGASAEADVNYFVEFMPNPTIGIPVPFMNSVPVTFAASVKATAGGDGSWAFARAGMAFLPSAGRLRQLLLQG
jgi:hypothetical protein